MAANSFSGNVTDECGPITKSTASGATENVVRIPDRIRELRRVRAKDLIANPRNWRRHPKAQADALRGLLSEIGYADALLVRELPDGKLMILDGHLRAQVTPDMLVPALVLDVSAEEGDKIMLTHDPLAAMAEADSTRIKALLETVRTADEAVQDLLRRTAGERVWEIVHPREMNETEVSLNRADELRTKWATESGQLWQIGPHRIICGDCADRVVVARLWAGGGPRLRLIWTDPPYGVNYSEKSDWMNRHGGGPKPARHSE
jgi:hypothetical protein